jgi:hypothetical protein
MRLLSVLFAIAATGCALSEDELYFEPLVFPAEARLGSTAAVLLDSNYIPLADAWEFYDLKRGRIQIWLEDDFGTRRQANLRQVFDLGAAPWSHYAQTAKGAWTTVALFDLPTGGLSFSGSPQIADVIIKIDGVENVLFRQGHIEITGSGGTPIAIEFPTTSGPQQLESESLLRLRAVRAAGGNPGFDDSWLIGGIEFDLEFFSCLSWNVRTFPDSNAVGATTLLGPIDWGSPWYFKTHVVLVDPKGFQLMRPPNNIGLGSETAAGEGPFLTIAFDRSPPVVCTNLQSHHFKVENLFVTDVNGQILIDRRGQGDSTDLVDMYVIDNDAT